VDDLEREWLGRHRAIYLEVARLRHDLMACSRSTAELFALTPQDRPQELAALHGRVLHLLHRHDQLEAEVRSLAADMA
jgi:hypothetical protein